MTDNPEHNLVRLPILNELVSNGWSRSSIICPSPDSSDSEWRVPKAPHEASKRELGRSFAGYPVDLAIFDSDEHTGEWDHILAILEFKQPDIDAGINQLMIYMSLEPIARYGYWTNGVDSAAVFRCADGTLEIEKHAKLPTPHDNLYRAGKAPLTFKDLKIPTESELNGIFEKLLGAIAGSDAVSTRPEQRLNEIANLLIIKLESDKVGYAHQDSPLRFQISDTPEETARSMNSLYREYKKTRVELFLKDDADTIRLSDASIQRAVLELQSINLKQVSHKALSIAFQVFREANLKIGDAQYFTPPRVISAGIKMLDITDEDKVIDPACGTAGFLYAAYETICDLYGSEPGQQAEARTWAHDKLFGVDRDSINIKLARALMVGMGDGSAHAYVGDSIRTALWKKDYPYLKLEAMSDESYSVVVTNPPFGKDLRVSEADCRVGKYEVAKHTPGGKRSNNYASTELGIVFVERAWRLLKEGGRLGIVLPETYFFSSSYEWFREWLFDHFILRGVLNIPMEAFQGFCRAKTNFYILQKKGEPSITTHVPTWFTDGKVWISNAPTIGINKDGFELYKVSADGKRLSEIDDIAIQDVCALLEGRSTETSDFESTGKEFIGIPKYSDHKAIKEFQNYVATKHPEFQTATLGDLIDQQIINVKAGHGSPSSDVRTGDIPYIKVSDLRAGLVNENSTNMVSRSVAERFWGGKSSGLKPFDVITPARACKNIGEIVLLLPGQEDIVITKEVLIFSPGEAANFDSFYLAWALDLPYVRQQWDRIIFMQTNREDVGRRYREISIPLPPSRQVADTVSAPYRNYYKSLYEIKTVFEASKYQ